MARSVNVTQTNWRATGVNVQMPQYELTETIEWTDDAGVTRSDTRTILFPNFLTQVGAGVRSRFAEELQDLIYRLHRKHLGID